MLTARHKLLLVLAAVFTTSLVVGDIIGGKLVELELWGQTFTLTVGMIPFPVTFLLTDLLNEFFGKRAARFVTWIGFAMAVLSYAYIFVGGAVPIANLTRDPGWQGVTEAAFNNVFLGSRRMILASLTAYLVAQFVDIAVFHALRSWTGKRLLWLRASGSTVVSQGVDTFTITLVAWWGVLDAETIVRVLVSSYVLKLLIAVGLTPAVYAGHALLERGLGLVPVSDTPEERLAPGE